MVEPSSLASVRSIVPSPPSATTMSASNGSSTSATPAFFATASTRATAPPTSTRPCVTMAAVLTRGDSSVDLLVEVIRKLRVFGVFEVKEELPVALRAWEPRVYDPRDLGLPTKRCIGDLAEHPA